MSACEKYEVWIQLALDDRLPSGEQVQLDRHLAHCPHCRACYRQFHEMQNLMQKLDGSQESTPPQLHQQILAYVARNSSEETGSFRQKKGWRPFRWVSAAAGIAVCIFVIFGAARFLNPQNSKSGDNEGLLLLRNSQEAESPTYDAKEEWSGFAQDQDSMKGPQAAPGANGSNAWCDDAGIPEASKDMVKEDANQEKEPIAVDLPPQNAAEGEVESKPLFAMKKILAVTGSRESLPEWIGQEAIFSQMIDGRQRDCLEFSSWKEESLVQELTNIGYLVEPAELESIAISEESDRLLLVFFWE